MTDTLFLHYMIVYYYRNVDQLSPELLEELIACLPQQQQEIVARMKSHRHRCEQTVAYIMLCHAIKSRRRVIADSFHLIRNFETEHLTPRYVKRNPPLWAFGEHGKPYITNYEGVHFNISHCNEAVAVAVSDRKVGIDVEGRRKFSDTLLQRAFSDEEQKAVRNSSDPQKEFACIWTRKEAWFKYTGTGILIDHLKTTEAEASDAGCVLFTIPIFNSDKGFYDFWLSVAENSARAK